MIHALPAFVIAVVIAAAATPLVRRLALRACLVDHAFSSRKIHSGDVPRLGGIAIVAAFVATVLGAIAADAELREAVGADVERTVGLLIGGLVVAALGLWDDVRGARARHKLAVQAAVALLAWWLGYRIDEVANPFGPPLQLGMFGLPFTVLWITGVVNAMNLTDGLDGLAAGIAIIAAATNIVVAGMHGQALLVVLSAALAGAALGFLFHNFHPASIFMGDTGSMFLGFVLATTSMQANQKSTASVALLVPLVALALPIGDTLLAMGRRAARGVPLFGADREHVHHRLLSIGLTHRQAVLALYGISMVLAVAALALAASPGWAATLAVVLGLVAGLALGLTRLGYVRKVRVPGVLEVRRRNLTLRSRVRELGLALQAARTPEDVWEHVRSAAQALGAGEVSLIFPVRTTDGGRARVAFKHGVEIDADCPRTRHSLIGERSPDGVLELGWTDGRRAVDRDTELALELFCEHIARALKQARRAPATADVVSTSIRRAANARSEA